MGDSFTNDFSWSVSRSQVFSRCLRKYYYRHYGSWGGWKRDAPAETRDLYLLKKLHTRHTWRGNLVHEAVACAVKSLLTDQPIDADTLREALLQRMRRQYRSSREGEYRQDPKRTLGLLEHEYERGVPEAEWKNTSRTARACVDAFFDLPIRGELEGIAVRRCRALEGDLSNPKNQWNNLPADPGSFVNSPLDLSPPDRFRIEDTDVWVKLDLAYETEEDRLAIVDWKTGQPREPDPLQMDVYGCYAHEAWGVNEERIDLSVIHLPGGERFDRRFTPQRRLEARERILDDVRTMQERLEDPDNNTADPADFPRIDNLSICRECRYRRVCRPDLASTSGEPEVDSPPNGG